MGAATPLHGLCRGSDTAGECLTRSDSGWLRTILPALFAPQAAFQSLDPLLLSQGVRTILRCLRLRRQSQARVWMLHILLQAHSSNSIAAPLGPSPSTAGTK